MDTKAGAGEKGSSMTVSFVSTAKAAEMLNVGRHSLTRLYRNGHLSDRRYRAGKNGTWSYYYRRWEIKALVKARGRT